ncbi:hypothetical protein IFR04_012618 [Cadophora malorum]|uniref:Uncharacterized protein n=1 Tax=Cadophora malorum TaxID=108018 RepID=A0A8H7T8H9_9HELO|nr:hypothetical protein IFR04_012618 [Cadophora malorum]
MPEYTSTAANDRSHSIPNPDFSAFKTEITGARHGSADHQVEKCGVIKTTSIQISSQSCHHSAYPLVEGFKVISTKGPDILEIQFYDDVFDMPVDALGASWAGRSLLFRSGYWIRLLRTGFKAHDRAFRLRMDNLNLPNVPRNRRSTNQFDVASKRVETERPVDQQIADELLAGVGDYSSEDIGCLKEELKFDQKLGREAKGKPPADREIRRVLQAYNDLCVSATLSLTDLRTTLHSRHASSWTSPRSLMIRGLFPAVSVPRASSETVIVNVTNASTVAFGLMSASIQAVESSSFKAQL